MVVQIPTSTSPFQFTEPIVTEEGLPTLYFLRKWQELLEINAAGNETIQLVNQILETEFTADNGLEGGGTLAEDEAINYGIAESGVVPGTYAAPTITVDEFGRITEIEGGTSAFAPTISSYFDGVPDGDAVLARYVATRPITLVEDFVNSQGFLEVAATAITVFDITKNGVSIGSMTFAASAVTATFASSPAVDVDFIAGDRVAVVAPTTPDATAAGVSFSLQTT